jgi:hypothetical protein
MKKAYLNVKELYCSVSFIFNNFNIQLPQKP